MLIGITGDAGSGKDTAGRFVVEYATRCKLPARRDAFADRLKVSAARALGFTGTTEECIGFCNWLKQEGRSIWVSAEGAFDPLPTGWENFFPRASGREYLQYYGTEAHRDVFGYGFWVDAVLDKYDSSEILVITDPRFVNEAEAIRAAGGQIWKVVRPGNQIAESSHASEAGLPDDLIDHTFINDGTLDEFEKVVIAKFEQQLYSYSPTLTEVD